jgi:hypothetical protein
MARLVLGWLHGSVGHDWSQSVSSASVGLGWSRLVSVAGLENDVSKAEAAVEEVLGMF